MIPSGNRVRDTAWSKATPASETILAIGSAGPESRVRGDAPDYADGDRDDSPGAHTPRGDVPGGGVKTRTVPTSVSVSLSLISGGKVPDSLSFNKILCLAELSGK